MPADWAAVTAYRAPAFSPSAPARPCGQGRRRGARRGCIVLSRACPAGDTRGRCRRAAGRHPAAGPACARCRGRRRPGAGPGTHGACDGQRCRRDAYEIWMGRAERDKLGAWDDNWAELSRKPQYESWRRLAGGAGRRPGCAALRDPQPAVGGHLCRGRRRAGIPATAQGASRCPAIGRRGGTPASAASAGRRFPALCRCPPVRRRRTASSTCSAGRDPRWSAPTAPTTGFVPAGRTAPCPPAGSAPRQRGGSAAASQDRLRDSRSLASYAFHTGAVPPKGRPGPRSCRRAQPNAAG